MILAGDVGGTNTRLGLFEVEKGRVRLVHDERVPSRGHRGFDEIVAQYIYVFLRDVARVAEPAASIPEELMGPDRPATIANAGFAGACPVCVQAVDLLVWFYGAEAGNLALKLMATGGVFLGGGIAPRILDRLEAPRFLQAFTSKGRMKPVLEAIPIRVILDDKASLIGAARCAAVRASFLDPDPGPRETPGAAGRETER